MTPAEATGAASQSESATVAVLIPSRDRPGPLQRCVESVLAQNYHDFRILIGDDASSPAINVSDFPEPDRIRVSRSDSVIGPIGTRTRLVEAASSPILVFLDDDITIPHPGTLSSIAATLGRPDAPGLVAPVVIDHVGDDQKVLGPLRRGDDGSGVPREIGVFVGAAYAIKREALASSIGTVVSSGYGHEEVEYSYLIAGQDKRMICDPRLVAHHFRTSGPPPTPQALKERFSSAVRNRFLISRRYLPQPYRSVHILFWIVRYFLMSLRRRMPLTFVKSLYAGLTAKTRERCLLSGRAISYLRRTGGRIWY